MVLMRNYLLQFLTNKLGQLKEVLTEVVNSECGVVPPECCGMADLYPSGYS